MRLPCKPQRQPHRLVTLRIHGMFSRHSAISNSLPVVATSRNHGLGSNRIGMERTTFRRRQLDGYQFSHHWALELGPW
jgi:hypothetical protein